jgi:simple sugar transport system ATP-binding protein
MSLLELKGVRKSFGAIEALRGVTFSVDAGSAVALVGDNGAGKSTLMKTITGVNRPDAGEIRFDGVSIVGRSRRIREAGIEMIYQDLALAACATSPQHFLGRELAPVLGVRFIDTNRMHGEARRWSRGSAPAFPPCPR